MVVVIIDQRMVMFKWLIIMCKIFNNMMPQVEGLCYIAEFLALLLTFIIINLNYE